VRLSDAGRGIRKIIPSVTLGASSSVVLSSQLSTESLPSPSLTRSGAGSYSSTAAHESHGNSDRRHRAESPGGRGSQSSAFRGSPISDEDNVQASGSQIVASPIPGTSSSQSAEQSPRPAGDGALNSRQGSGEQLQERSRRQGSVRSSGEHRRIVEFDPELRRLRMEKSEGIFYFVQ